MSSPESHPHNGGGQRGSRRSAGSVYLDHAATTPLYDAALEAVVQALRAVGNPSSLHGAGRSARRRVEESREQLASLLGARPSEVVFTAGGTESVNLAVKGIYWARRSSDSRRHRIIVPEAEHSAVLDAVQWLESHEGAELTWVPVDGEGRIDPEAFRRAVEQYGHETALATVMWANNEVGTINPVDDLAAVADGFGIPLHSDAIQAAGHVPVDFSEAGLAAMSIAAHKFGGPPGAGALLLKRDVQCTPLLHGGGHEREIRSGTVDAPGICGMAAAAGVAAAGLDEESTRVHRLRDRLISGVRRAVPDVLVTGPSSGPSLPSIAHFTFPGCEGDSLLMLLDAAGIQCSTGSACTSGVPQASHVLIAMGIDPSSARGALRFSLGHTTTESDIDRVLEVLPGAVDRARAAGMAGGNKSGRPGGRRRGDGAPSVDDANVGDRDVQAGAGRSGTSGQRRETVR